MRIAIAGKGGCGKSTLSTLIAKKMNRMGYKVLLVDADESNFGLHRLAGLPLPTGIMDNLGGKAEFKKKMNQTFPGEEKPFSRETAIDDLPEVCVSQKDGLRLAVIGKIHHYGEGCACAIGMLSRQVLSSLSIDTDEIVIVDTEAGIEHFGRRLDAECDLILGVVDPTYESLQMAARIQEMANQAGVAIYFVLNKVNDETEPLVTQSLSPDKILARIPQDNQVFMDSLKGDALTADLPGIEPICRYIEKMKQEKR